MNKPNYFDELDAIHGKGTFETKVEPIQSGIPISVFDFSKLTGLALLPSNSFLEIVGEKDTGKTSTALRIAGDAIHNGNTVAYVDVTGGFTSSYGNHLGINIKKLLVNNVETLEDLFTLCQIYVENKVELVIIDSLAYLPMERELASSFIEVTDDKELALARLWEIKNKIQPLKVGSTSFIFVSPKGSNLLTPFMDLIIETSVQKSIKKYGELVGRKLNLKEIKNRIALSSKKREVNYNLFLPQEK